MFCIVLSQAMILNSSLAKVIGPFASIAAAMAWGDAHLPDDAVATIEPFTSAT